MAIPGYKLPWYRNPAAGALAADVVVALTAATSAALAMAARGIDLVSPTGLLPMAGFVGAALKAALTWREKAKSRRHQGLEGCLFTLYTVLLASSEQGVAPELRLTIHVPVNGGNELEQLLNYVGGDPSKRTGAGRRTSQHCGIIGHAYRNNQPLAASRESENYEDYVKELSQKWGFSEAQARVVSHQSRSFMAVPFAGEGGVEAVLYIDSTKANYFTPNRTKLVVDACTGIALFIDRAYTKGS
jgi:hypothetical protein